MIPCQVCHKMDQEKTTWFVCDKCGFRVCPGCLTAHQGPHGGGYKCSQCPFGKMQQQ